MLPARPRHAAGPPRHAAAGSIHLSLTDGIRELGGAPVSALPVMLPARPVMLPTRPRHAAAGSIHLSLTDGIRELSHTTISFTEVNYVVGAKQTKPGSKASSRGAQKTNGKPPRVPVGTLHYVDPDNQQATSAMYDAICGETHLVVVDDEWDGPAPNDRCQPCADAQWAAEFGERQNQLLK